MGETCGVVTGSIMVIGLKSGWIKADDKEAKEKCYNLAREFMDRFKSRNSSVLCRDLIDCDISTPEGLKSAREKRLFIIVCPQFVQDAAEILEQIL